MMKVIFIVGHHGVGKTHLMNNYLNDNDVYTFDAGPFLRNKLKSENPMLSMQNWVAELEAKDGYFATTNLMAKEIFDGTNGCHYKFALLFGFRHLDCIKHLVEILKFNDWEVVFLDASFELIKKNYENREKVKLSDRAFERELEEEDKWGLGELLKWTEVNQDKAVKIYKEKNDNSFKQYIDKMLER